MSFSSKIEKPLQSYCAISPSLTLQRKPFAVEKHQQKRGEATSISLQTQMEQAARLGHHLSQIALSSNTPTVQAKLSIGQPGDRYEQEADQVAQQVMTMPEAKMQRQEMPQEEEELQMKPKLQRQMEPEEEEIQTKSIGQQFEAMDSSSLEQQLSSSKGGGSPLGNDIRNFMEPRFGANFSQVKIHTDSSANQMNQSIQAQAFTHGKDIYFNAGKYSPNTDEGKTLLAHELTHVVQQTGEG